VPLAEEQGQTMYDLAVIGGGPGGYVAAIRAAQLGAKTVLIEKDVLGGTCLNRGCIPTKTFLQSVKALREIKKLRDLGVTGVDPAAVGINLEKLQQRKKRIVNRLTMGIAGLLKAHGVEVVAGEAFLDEEPGLVKLYGNQAPKRAVRARHVIIATGSKPRRLSIPGMDAPAVITSDEILALERVPASLAILGGGVIGLEFALILRELGAEVTVIEMEERLLPVFDEEIAGETARMLKTSGITLHLGAQAREIRGDTLVFTQGEEIRELKAEKILVAVGRVPAIDGVDWDKLGIKTERGALVTDEYLRTSRPDVYAIGDVNGKCMLAHKASAEAMVAVENLFGSAGPRKMDYAAIPQCVYSFPEIAWVGLTEQQARAQYGAEKLAIGKFPLVANGKAQIEGEARGFVKVITEKETGKILGVHLFCPAATEMIAEAVTAIKLGAGVEQLKRCIHPHPTISESLQEAYADVLHEAIHFSR